MDAEYPVIRSTGSNPGNPAVRSGSAVLSVDPLPMFDNGVLQLERLGTAPVVVSYIAGGIRARCRTPPSDRIPRPPAHLQGDSDPRGDREGPICFVERPQPHDRALNVERLRPRPAISGAASQLTSSSTPHRFLRRPRAPDAEQHPARFSASCGKPPAVPRILPHRRLGLSRHLLLWVAGSAHAAGVVVPNAAWLLDQVKILTAPETEGRGSGTAGADRRARHIAAVFQAAGLSRRAATPGATCRRSACRPASGWGPRIRSPSSPLLRVHWPLSLDFMPLAVSTDGSGRRATSPSPDTESPLPTSAMTTMRGSTCRARSSWY